MAIVLAIVGMVSPGKVQAAEDSKASEFSKVPPISDGPYQLQLNSFKVEANAKSFFNRLVKKGYKPFMVFVDEGEPWFKVRMGPFPSRETAERIAEELKEKHSLSSLVLFAGKNDPGPSGGSSLKKNSSVKMTKTALPSPKASLKPVATKNTGSSIDVVLSQFLVWLKAWQGKQFDSYFSFYSKNFESDGKPFVDWQESKKKSLDLIQQIKIEVDDLEMSEKGDTVEMSFIERYQSNVVSDIRRKTLVWKREKGRWRIIAESSEPA
ncbi:MAG: hypothetical protein NPINA01_32820 [Nitrospinaceae bacterium]|nr:MAG: hypothetical protein NPINA01_32820 [Nitrospinaceae bacterium]